MNDDLLADLAAQVGLVNKHDDAVFATYSLMPFSKMSYLANEIVYMNVVGNAAQVCCLDAGYPIRLSKKDDKYICIVERSWVTVTHEDLNRAIIEACVLTLEGIQKGG